MKFLAIAVWALLAFYSLLCIFLPEVRPYHRGFRWRKFGLCASICLALFFWFWPLVYAGELTGMISPDSRTYMWGLFSLLIFVAIVGSWIEYLSD